MFVAKAIWSRAVVSELSTIEEAIINLEATGLKLALIINSNEQLVGIVTDGDIRRGFIQGSGLRSSVFEIMNSTPATVNEGMLPQQVAFMMENLKVQHIPVVDKSMNLIGLHVADGGMVYKPRMNRVVIMAGGKGIRMRPLTEYTPKPMLLVAGRPILEHIIERFKEQGFSVFTICIGYLGELIKEYFEDGSKWDVEIEYLSEESPLGTAGPMRNLQNIGDLPFIVTNGDIISEIDMVDLVEFHIEQRSVATMAIRSHEMQNQFGVVETNGIEISAIIEKPIYRTQISTGVYVFDPNVLKQFPNSDVLQMPDLFNYLRNLGNRTLAFHIQDQWIDLANQEDIRETQKIISKSKNRQS
jgi:dTDP-glucose pyrophosphorylase